MPTVKVRDLNVQYDDIGTGRPLLVIHGRPFNRRIFASLYEPHFEGREGWRRLYPNLLDYGDITPPSWMHGTDSLVDVLVEFMDAVAPGERFVVAGALWGGYLARAVVQRRLKQVDGVLIEVPLMSEGRTGHDLPARQVFQSDPEFAAALQQFIAGLPPGYGWLQDLFVAQSPEAWDRFRADVIANWSEPNPAIDLIVGGKPLSVDPDVLPEPCLAPALFITGRQDHFLGYKQAYSILDNFPRATFAVLDRAGHWMFHEQPALRRSLISEWLDRVEEFTNSR